jgi:O-antigen/teichoic acid export membrane protein
LAVTVKHNVVANFAGKLWSALMALAFLPLYVRFLGIESYGLIGIFISLTVLLSVFDMGLSTTLSKELARLSARPESEQEAKDLVRTFELIYWGMGALLGGGIALLAPFIARDWLNAHGVAADTMEQAIMIMGLVLALQWPNSLYSGGLMGLQRQVLLNAIRAGAATLQSGGAVLVLWLVSPTIFAFFLWQVLASALHTATVAAWLWKSFPESTGPVFRKDLLANNWRFAGGMTGITLLATVLTQTDKIVLSKMLSLEMFAYYSLAVVIAGALNYISGSIFSALFPRFTQVIGSGNAQEVTALYHKGSQLMAALVSPLCIFMALFSEELLLLWFGDERIVAGAHLLVSLLVTGTALNAFMTLPLALQLAHGWTALSFYKNVVSIAVFVPLLFWLIERYGAAGAALAWIGLNGGYLLFEIPLMHRRLLKGSMVRWYLVDIALPVALCLGIGVSVRLGMPSGLPSYAVLLWIMSGLVLSFLCLVLAMPHTREWVRMLAFPGASGGVKY